VPPPTPDLRAPRRLTTGHQWDMHPTVAEPPATPRQVHVPQRSHTTQFACSTRATSTGSATLFGRVSFLVLLPDASESCFFFPMAGRRHAVVGWDRRRRWCGRWQGRCRSLFKGRASAGHDAIDCGVEVQPPPVSARAVEMRRRHGSGDHRSGGRESDMLDIAL
jgi:hypothetical protein